MALRGGPADGKVVQAVRANPEIQIVSTTVFGVRTHIYKIDKPSDEISEAIYVKTTVGLPRDD